MRNDNLSIVVFDIDGTIAITGDRLKCITETIPKDWDGFHDRVMEDEENEPVMDILRGLVRLRCYRIVYCTGRMERNRAKTMQWLDDHNIILHPEDLYMRAEGDYRQDTIVKPELLKDLLTMIVMAFEDRGSMTAKWRELGITCLQVAEGAF
jgi:DNA-directed RNA polymerase subunit N (RpoN/RPB10)